VQVLRIVGGSHDDVGVARIRDEGIDPVVGVDEPPRSHPIGTSCFAKVSSICSIRPETDSGHSLPTAESERRSRCDTALKSKRRRCARCCRLQPAAMSALPAARGRKDALATRESGSSNSNAP